MLTHLLRIERFKFPLIDSLAPDRCPRSQHRLDSSLLQHHCEEGRHLGLEGGWMFHPHLLRLGRWRCLVGRLHPVCPLCW